MSRSEIPCARGAGSTVSRWPITASALLSVITVGSLATREPLWRREVPIGGVGVVVMGDRNDEPEAATTKSDPLPRGEEASRACWSASEQDSGGPWQHWLTAFMPRSMPTIRHTSPFSR